MVTPHLRVREDDTGGRRGEGQRESVLLLSLRSGETPYLASLTAAGYRVVKASNVETFEKALSDDRGQVALVDLDSLPPQERGALLEKLSGSEGSHRILLAAGGKHGFAPDQGKLCNDIEALFEPLSRPQSPSRLEDGERLLKNELDSLMAGIRPFVDDVQVSLFSRFPRSSLVHTCLRARMAGNPEVVWCARSEGCERVTRRSWSWYAEDRGCCSEAGPVVVCAAVVPGRELAGVVKVATRGEEARYGRLTVARLLGKVVAAQLKALDDHGRLGRLRVSRAELQRAVLDAQEKEREWIGFEVHDGIAQTLSATLYYLQAARKSEEQGDPRGRSFLIRGESLLRQAILETRSILRGLMPPRLKSVGLVKALREEVRYFQEACGCSVEFEGSDVSLPEEVSRVLYRIASEALSNIRRHAGAERVRLAVEPRDSQVLLEVVDWGRGFEIERVKRGTGLEGMRRRAESIGGSFSLSSTPGAGTTIRAEVPVHLGSETDEG